MVIKVEIADFDVGRVLIDIGSSIHVLFTDAFEALEIEDRHINRTITRLLSFSEDVVQPVGSI